MKVRLLTSLAGAGGAFSAGDEYECASGDEAKRLIDAGFAEPIRGAKVETTDAAPKVETTTKRTTRRKK